MTAGAASARSFDELLGPLLDPGYRLATAILGDQSLAEDAVQEAAFKAWRRIDTVRDPTALKAWFLSIVANQCRSMRRGRWWSVLPFLPGTGGPTTFQEGVVAEGIDITRALNRLPAQDRAALLLHFYYELTYAEVGRCLGISMTAARSRIHRASRRIRPDLEVTELG
jgi:RNA polymerase sigma-70 factor, ECF subfamily